MKHDSIISLISILALSAGMASCDGSITDPDNISLSGKTEMTFSFIHPSQQSRATETSFESGDIAGIFVAEATTPLEIAGNIVNNEALTFSGSAWNSGRKLYWDDGQFDIYAYYPYCSNVSSTSDLPFDLALDQNAATPSGIDGYEASDFLFASARAMTASAEPVNMQFSHIMSKISVRLIKGDDFDGEIPDNATVYIHNTVTRAGIDLAAGVATKDPRASRQTIVARRNSTTDYSAIIVPQRLENRVPLIEVVMNGVSFLYESKFVFKPGIHHIINLVIDKNPEQIKIEIGGEITDWN